MIFHLLGLVPTIRQTWAITFIIVVGLMSYGLYSQYVLGLEPCPLCITQRLFYCLIGVFALLAWLQNPNRLGIKVYAVLVVLSALGGVASAGRQVWLQHLPLEQVPACGPNLRYMLDVLPFSEVVQALISGDGHCADIMWRFWGLSMAEWSLVWFVFFGVMGVWQLLRKIQVT